MSYDDCKTAYFNLLSAAVDAVPKAGRNLQDVRGVALFDEAKDSLFTTLETFDVLVKCIGDLELVEKRYGAIESRRIALQLVYEYFARSQELIVDPTIADSLWVDFCAELESQVWVTRCVTNLRNFRSEENSVDFGDGVAIHGRSKQTLAELGFSDYIAERVFADWGGFGASSFVMVSETSEPKSPKNFITVDANQAYLKCIRAIGALRLVAPGEIGLSTIFVQRAARFNVGIGGVTALGFPPDTVGDDYGWSSAKLPRFAEIYSGLAELEKIGYDKSPGNLDLALRAFMSTYDRFPQYRDTILVDAITALEAVLGTENEIAFRLSFRVASLLASTNDERTEMFSKVRNFYDARSRIVHGGKLRPKHSKSHAAANELRDIVRRLLSGLVLFASGKSGHVEKRPIMEELDTELLHSDRREELRRKLGLS